MYFYTLLYILIFVYIHVKIITYTWIQYIYMVLIYDMYTINVK